MLQNQASGRAGMPDVSSHLSVLGVLSFLLACGPAAVDPAAAASCAYVTDYDSGELAVVDLAERRVVDRVRVGNGPVDVAVTPDGAFAYVTNFLADTVSVVSTARNAVVATIDTEDAPSGVAVRRNGAAVYVAHHVSDSILVIDPLRQSTETVIRIPPGSCSPADRCGLNGVAVGPDDRYAFVVSARKVGIQYQIRLFVIDTAINDFALLLLDFGNLALFGDAQPPGPLPGSVAALPNGSLVLASDWLRLKVRVFDGAGTSQSTPFDELQVFDLAAAPDSQTVYATTVACEYNGALLFCRGTVELLDPATRAVRGAVDTTECEPYDPLRCIGGTCPEAARCFATGVAVSADGSEVYALDYHTATLSVIDSRTQLVAATVAVGGGPVGLAVAEVSGGCVPAPTQTPTATSTAPRTPTVTRTATAVASRTPTERPVLGPCVGDCNEDGAVAVSELVRGVAIGLGRISIDACAKIDVNGDRAAGIDELVRAVAASLRGCR